MTSSSCSTSASSSASRTASEAHPDANRVLTRQMRLLGTPAYMPPERIGHPSDVDARADVYGVGVLIYFLTAGRAPFPGNDQADILREVLATPAPRLADVMPSVPAQLDDLVARCLAKPPIERPGAIGDIQTVLASVTLPPWTRDNARAWWETLARGSSGRRQRQRPRRGHLTDGCFRPILLKNSLRGTWTKSRPLRTAQDRRSSLG